ncbi:MAG: UDP-N-acetylmuramoyl-L-alanyl-D-glutamate--2,6-diaminopimelate ligase [Rhodothermaceae bacterium]|nr:UDP-N-acetylmuramoyl-L-alanyl-D-glutamate--2,6-diaminopimelate ligase [Rhodothermaceae bacterium]MYF63053.1 UDP-N-acetylmuramoyl-L-alanyl-D-glutamate--2,6-diaminopimelate ligase [Rhodothermaceae bacterium]MYI84821.1 UDP-N-acetylmuramoyl-L-alanyl-D-glutamate--2,6-diaminopimelate ligase [Rhodothermaceae bacterium]
MNWSDLHIRLTRAGLAANAIEHVPETAVTGVTQDSRKVQPGYVFVAVRGHQADGHTYIRHALEAGARMIVCEEAPEEVSNTVQVRNTRKAAAVIAAAFYGDPARSLHLTGVTGTNGKTTTSTLIRHVLEHTGTSTGLIGTVTCLTGQSTYTSTLTTPDATELQPMLAQMVDSGCKACVIEVSSHALDQCRTTTLDFSVGVFTNLMHDHLDYHGTTERYLAAKKRLFDGLDSSAVAVYNQDDAAGERMIQNTRAARCSYGQDPNSDIQFSVVQDNPSGLRLRLDGQTSSFRLAGHFNAYNLAAAYGAARATGLPGADVIEALADAPPVDGRFEQYLCDDDTRVIIDFAHTPDALEQALRAARRLRARPARLWCVFGCGGDRDQVKRPLMGAVAERLADRVVVTNDNPRDESPEAIAEAILSGMLDPDQVQVIPSRPEAIRHVAQACKAGDLVLVAGKGHESVQTEKGVQTRMRDQNLVREAFAPRNPQPAI